MASVRLDFVPPSDPDIVELRIYESPASTGSFSEIERVTVSADAYPTRYTTTFAQSITDWFAIQWVDSKGALTDMSAPVKGGTTTLVAKVVDRVLQRDPSLDENVVTQEAEGAIQYVYGDMVDPYDPSLQVSYRELNGLTALVLARAYIQRSVSFGASAVDSATLGLVSFKSSSGSTTTTVDVQALIDMANKDLGISTSYVMQLQAVCDAPYFQTFDISRLTSGWISIEP